MGVLVKSTLLVAALILIGSSFGKIIRAPRGDFPRHVEFGRRIFTGQCIYDGGLDVPYPPFWALVHAPLSQLPLDIAQPLVFPLGLISLGVLVMVLNSLTQTALAVDRQALFWVWSAVFLLSARFLYRDWDECGPNTALLTLAWLAVWLWTRQHDIVAGIPLGLAIALKCTAGLFVAYFLFRRQWKFAASSIAATIAFTLSPALVEGSSNYTRDMRVWVETLSGGLAAPSPIVGVLGEEPLINKSLRSTLGRYLMRLPEGHIGRVDHPAYVDVFDLSGRTASRIVYIATIAVLIALGWMFRHPVSSRGDVAHVWECAIVSLAALLLSPISWSQHFVATVPAVFVIARRIAAGEWVPGWSRVCLAAYFGLVVIFNRAMFPGNLGYALDSYRPATWAVVLLLVVMCRFRASDAATVVRGTSLPLAKAA